MRIDRHAYGAFASRPALTTHRRQNSTKRLVAICALLGFLSLYFFEIMSFVSSVASVLIIEDAPNVRASSSPQFLRVFHYATSSGTLPKAPDHMVFPQKEPKIRQVPWSKGAQRRQDYLRDEEYYDDEDHIAESPYHRSPECIPMHDWQTKSFPSCNALHQLDLSGAKFVAKGFFRDVWLVSAGMNNGGGEEPLALKTLRATDDGKHDFDQRNYHRHRVDAISYERLTSSPHVMNIFGFCGQSGVFEYAPEGDLSDALADNKLGKEERFRIGIQVALSIADLHNFNGKAPAIAHSDIWHSQFVKSTDNNGGIYKLSDFNRAQFLYWNSTSDSGNCPYYYQHSNGYPFRSPEEYKYEAQTEKIDVYSSGNIYVR